MRTALAALALALVLVPAARAQDEGREAALQTAVTRGVRWLVDQQQADGSWTYENTPMRIEAYPMTQGVTALCALTLLKCGLSPDEPPVKKAFDYIHEQKLTWSYSTGCVLLALEAKTNFDPGRKPLEAEDTATMIRDKKQNRPDGRDRKLAEQCVAWLVAHQRDTGLWRYAGGSDEDLSCAQYALLGLDAAERMGVKVPREVYEKAAARLVATQHPGDEKVDPFPVPGADSSYRELRKVEEGLRRELKKLSKKFKEPGEKDKDGLGLEDHMQTAERKASQEILESMQRGAMTARGWSYVPPEKDTSRDWQKAVTASVTCSALASLFICKAHLEGAGRFERDLEGKVVQSLRDGAAWMAKNFSVKGNPGHPQGLHHYYYCYGLERAGVIGLVHRFGQHEWWDEGVDMFLDQQTGDGSWKAWGSTSGPVPDTCFALLFLSKGTTPVVGLPRRVMTGAGSREEK